MVSYCYRIIIVLSTGDNESMNMYEVHLHESNLTGRSWLPFWHKQGTKLDSLKKCPDGHTQKLVLVQARDIV